MKKRFLFAALGLAVALFVLGQSSAKADHRRSTCGAGYGGYGSFYGGVGVAPVYPVAPSYGYGSYGHGYQNYGSAYGGHDHHDHHHAAPYRNRGHYGRGYGTNIQVITPNFHLGVRH